MRNLLFLLFSCTTDVGIINVTKSQDETGAIDTAIETIDTGEEPDTNEVVEEISGTVGLIEWELEQIACPACMGVSQEITVQFNVDFHEKINEEHPTWVPPQGQCQQSLNYITLSRNKINLGSLVSLQGSYSSFQAYNQNNVYSTFMQESQYERDTQYRLITQDGDSLSFKSFHGFDYIEPLELRYVDPSYAFAAPVYRSGTTFWWGPSGSNSTFNITLAVYSQDGSSLLGYTSCSGGDTGMMTIPGQYLSSFPVWSLVAVHMTRFDKQRVTFEKLNGYIDVHLYWSVVGTGHIE